AFRLGVDHPLYPQGVVSAPARRLSIEERRLTFRGGGGPPPPRRRRALGGSDRRRRPRQLPSLLMRDPLTLLDHKQVDEPRQGIAEEPEILLPVARRQGQ